MDMENTEVKNEVIEETVTEVKAEKADKKESKAPRKDGKREFKKFNDKKNLLEDKVVSIGRVTKVTKGGRHFRFSATVVVGNRKGLVGIGNGKANEVPEAIKKAIQVANKNVVKVALIDNRTIPHEAIAQVGRARVLIKPAPEGTGIKAGGSARVILELAGVKDVISKSLGSNTKVNVAKATLEALVMQKTPEHIAELRGKKVEEL
jgi:small subunit ribosomal protein S5